jgi:hypothetical protein
MGRWLPVLVVVSVAALAGVALLLGGDDEAGETTSADEPTTATLREEGFETICYGIDVQTNERTYLPCTDTNCSQSGITCLDLPTAQVEASCFETAGYWDCTTTTTPPEDGLEYLDVADLDQSPDDFCTEYMDRVPDGVCWSAPEEGRVYFGEGSPTETVPTDLDGDGVIEPGEQCVRFTETGEEFCGE